MATDPATPVAIVTPDQVQTWIGQKTGIPTETWLTIAKVAGALLLSTGVVKPADATTLYGALTNLVVASVAVIASAWTIVNYTKARTAHKTAAMSSTISTAQTTVKS